MPAVLADIVDHTLFVGIVAFGSDHNLLAPRC
jgi:hypothetical protein